MPDVYLTRVEDFCAAHRLYNPELDDEENLEIYGKCANPQGHGHNYRLWVTIRGEADPRTGMLLELSRFSEIIRGVIVDRVDHRYLNEDVDFLEGVIPTAENLALAFWRELEHRLPAGRL